ncbi:hypothetical protein [Qipengyuania atrilutea]|uniref:Uncharacterized protein n=1 Tax=Qipengyuania atrilutea TaxID=2744473 RepID=A0A850GYW4_9SPHN|nr:hypothetical protein [Actirhodobacter atriluteus]NVD44844.1 hypothetical protein [Actirhodobacter atriluteus]
MSGNVIPFPKRPADQASLRGIGKAIEQAIPLPPRDPELALLAEMCAQLLDTYSDGLCGSFLDRLDAWERANATG